MYPVPPVAARALLKLSGCLFDPFTQRFIRTENALDRPTQSEKCFVTNKINWRIRR